MSDVFDFYIYDDRSIQFALAEPILLEDKNVTEFRFRIPKSLNGFDMSDWEWWFVFVNPKGTKYTTLLELTDDEDEPDEYSVATYTVGYGFSGIVGTVRFSIEALNVSGEEIVNEWHTKTYSTAVIDTLQGLRAVIPEPGGQTIESLISNLDARVTALEAGIDSMTIGIDEEDGLLYMYVNGVKQGEGVEIGGDSGTRYNITYNLINASSSYTYSKILEGKTFKSVITPSQGFEIKTVSVTMGGTTLQNVFDSTTSTITVPNVSGDIGITVVAEIMPIDLLDVTWANHAITCGQDTNNYNAWSPHNLQYDAVNDCFVFLQCHANKHLSPVYTTWTLSAINPYDSTDYEDITIPEFNGLGMLFVENGVWTLLPRNGRNAYRSSDRGLTWETLSANIPQYIFGVYKCGDTYLAGNDSNNEITYYKSDDLLTWETVSFDSALGYSVLCETTFCEYDGKWWAFNRTNDATLGHPVILQSTDEGETWELFSDQMLHGYKSTVSCYPFENYIMVADIDRAGGILYYNKFDGTAFEQLNSWKVPKAGDDFHNVNIASNYKDTVVIEFMHATSGYDTTSGSARPYTDQRACENVMIVGSTKELPSLTFNYLDNITEFTEMLNEYSTVGLNSQRNYTWEAKGTSNVQCNFGETVSGFDDEIEIPLNLIMLNTGTRPQFVLKAGASYAKAWSNSVTNPSQSTDQFAINGTLQQAFITINGIRYALGIDRDRRDVFPVLTRQNHVVSLNAYTPNSNENVVVGETWQETLGFRRVYSVNYSPTANTYYRLNVYGDWTEEHPWALISYAPVSNE